MGAGVGGSALQAVGHAGQALGLVEQVVARLAGVTEHGGVVNGARCAVGEDTRAVHTCPIDGIQARLAGCAVAAGALAGLAVARTWRALVVGVEEEAGETVGAGGRTGAVGAVGRALLASSIPIDHVALLAHGAGVGVPAGQAVGQAGGALALRVQVVPIVAHGAGGPIAAGLAVGLAGLALVGVLVEEVARLAAGAGVVVPTLRTPIAPSA